MRSTWFISWLLAFPLLKILTGVQIRGRVPKRGAYIIACNHQSFLDPPVVGICAFREIFFLAKVGLFGLSGWFTRLIEAYNAIPISGTQGLRTAITRLKEGQALAIFPEGTRSKDGCMLPFNPGVGYLAVNYRIPVIPAHVTNSNRPWGLIVLRWYQLRIQYGHPVYPRGFTRNAQGYQQFADRVREEVIKLQ
ncbi:1-acyl-sn-glycerol-3-phosphate acyltransferase [candidate division WOR-3 bacterium]|nr:1-acyl-sn-glycerol-3-phosphate acyltransferase [candidate division WOR-3 bacterium]